VHEDDVGVVDFPQHLLNSSLRTASSVHECIRLHQSIL